MDEQEFEEVVAAALDSLPTQLGSAMSNVELVVEDEPPPGQPLLGLYEGIPLTLRTSGYTGVPPDKITIYRGPLERHHGRDSASLAPSKALSPPRPCRGRAPSRRCA